MSLLSVRPEFTKELGLGRDQMVETRRDDNVLTPKETGVMPQEPQVVDQFSYIQPAEPRQSPAPSPQLPAPSPQLPTPEPEPQLPQEPQTRMQVNDLSNVMFNWRALNESTPSNSSKKQRLNIVSGFLRDYVDNANFTTAGSDVDNESLKTAIADKLYYDMALDNIELNYGKPLVLGGKAYFEENKSGLMYELNASNNRPRLVREAQTNLLKQTKEYKQQKGQGWGESLLNSAVTGAMSPLILLANAGRIALENPKLQDNELLQAVMDLPLDLVDRVKENFESYPRSTAQRIVGEAAKAVSAMASMAAVTRSPVGTVGGLSLTSGSEKTLDTIETKKKKSGGELKQEDYSQSLMAGLEMTGIEAVTEAVPMKILFKPGMSFLKRLAAGMVTDVPGELIVTGTEMAHIDKKYQGKDYTPEQYALALLETAAVAGLVTGTATIGSQIGHRAKKPQKAPAKLPEQTKPTDPKVIEPEIINEFEDIDAMIDLQVRVDNAMKNRKAKEKAKKKAKKKAAKRKKGTKLGMGVNIPTYEITPIDVVAEVEGLIKAKKEYQAKRLQEDINELGKPTLKQLKQTKTTQARTQPYKKVNYDSPDRWNNIPLNDLQDESKRQLFVDSLVADLNDIQRSKTATKAELLAVKRLQEELHPEVPIYDDLQTGLDDDSKALLQETYIEAAVQRLEDAGFTEEGGYEPDAAFNFIRTAVPSFTPATELVLAEKEGSNEPAKLLKPVKKSKTKDVYEDRWIKPKTKAQENDVSFQQLLKLVEQIFMPEIPPVEINPVKAYLPKDGKFTQEMVNNVKSEIRQFHNLSKKASRQKLSPKESKTLTKLKGKYSYKKAPKKSAIPTSGERIKEPSKVMKNRPKRIDKEFFPKRGQEPAKSKIAKEVESKYHPGIPISETVMPKNDKSLAFVKKWAGKGYTSKALKQAIGRQLTAQEYVVAKNIYSKRDRSKKPINVLDEPSYARKKWAESYFDTKIKQKNQKLNDLTNIARDAQKVYLDAKKEAKQDPTKKKKLDKVYKDYKTKKNAMKELEKDIQRFREEEFIVPVIEDYTTKGESTQYKKADIAGQDEITIDEVQPTNLNTYQAMEAYNYEDSRDGNLVNQLDSLEARGMIFYDDKHDVYLGKDDPLILRPTPKMKKHYDFLLEKRRENYQIYGRTQPTPKDYIIAYNIGNVQDQNLGKQLYKLQIQKKVAYNPYADFYVLSNDPLALKYKDKQITRKNIDQLLEQRKQVPPQQRILDHDELVPLMKKRDRAINRWNEITDDEGNPRIIEDDATAAEQDEITIEEVQQAKDEMDKAINAVRNKRAELFANINKTTPSTTLEAGGLKTLFDGIDKLVDNFKLSQKIAVAVKEDVVGEDFFSEQYSKMKEKASDVSKQTNKFFVDSDTFNNFKKELDTSITSLATRIQDDFLDLNPEQITKIQRTYKRLKKDITKTHDKGIKAFHNLITSRIGLLNSEMFESNNYINILEKEYTTEEFEQAEKILAGSKKKASKKARELAKTIRKYYDSSFDELVAVMPIEYRKDYVTEIFEVEEDITEAEINRMVYDNPFARRREDKKKKGIQRPLLEKLKIYNKYKIRTLTNHKFVLGVAELNNALDYRLMKNGEAFISDYKGYLKSLKKDEEELSLVDFAAQQGYLYAGHTSVLLPKINKPTMEAFNKLEYPEEWELRQDLFNKLNKGTKLPRDEAQILDAIEMKFNDFFVHEDIVDDLNNMVKTKSEHKLVSKYETVNAVAKTIELMFTLFHHGTLIESSIFTGDFWKSTKFLKDSIKGGVLPAQLDTDLTRRALQAGLNISFITDVQQTKVDDFMNSLIDKSGYTKPLLKAVKAIKKLNDKGLWDYLHTSFKLVAWQSMVARNMKNNPDMSLYQVEQTAATMVNDKFGGQNLDALRVDPKLWQLSQAILLAPDWTLSQLRVAGLTPKSFGRPFRQGMEGKEARNYWKRAAVTMFVVSNVLNYTFTAMDDEEEGRFLWDNPEGSKLNLYFGKDEYGNETYLRWGKQIKEPLYWFLNPRTTLGYKISPMGKMITEQATGKTTTGYDLRLTDERGSEVVKRAKAIGDKFVPFSVKGNSLAYMIPIKTHREKPKTKKYRHENWRKPRKARSDPSRTSSRNF